MEASDFELVRKIKAGDQIAFDIFIRRWYPRIFRYVLKMIAHEQDAYDVTQEVFLAVLRSIASYRPWKKIDSWLFTIAHHKCIDYFRIRADSVSLDALDLDLPSLSAPLDEIAATTGRPKGSIKAALLKRPLAQREAVVLHYYHQFSVREIARMTKAPIPTVKSRLSAARKTLSLQLREEVSWMNE